VASVATSGFVAPTADSIRIWLRSLFTGQVPSVIYYSKVGAELAKLVFKGQNMTPP
jgi:hypothetical protein